MALRFLVLFASLELFFCLSISGGGIRYGSIEDKIAAVFNKVATRVTTPSSDGIALWLPPSTASTFLIPSSTEPSTTKTTSTTTATTTTVRSTTTAATTLEKTSTPPTKSTTLSFIDVEFPTSKSNAFSARPTQRSTVLSSAAILVHTTQPSPEKTTDQPPQPTYLVPELAYRSLGLFWQVPIYVLACLYGLLSIYAAICAVRIIRLPCRGYLLTTTIFVFTWSLLQCFQMLLEVFAAQGSLPQIVDNLLTCISSPLPVAAFAFVFLTLIHAADVQIFSRKLQNPITLLLIVIAHLALAVGAGIAIPRRENGHVIFLVLNVFHIVWCVVLSVAYAFGFRRILQAARRQEFDVQQEISTQYHMEGHLVPKKFGGPTLSRAAHVLVFAALVNISVCVLMILGLVLLFGPMSDGKARPWPWWGHQLTCRLLELLLCTLVIALIGQSFRRFYFISSKVWLDAFASKCSVFCMSPPCLSQTWQSDSKNSALFHQSSSAHDRNRGTLTQSPCQAKMLFYLRNGTGNPAPHEADSANEMQAFPSYCYSISRVQQLRASTPQGRAAEQTLTLPHGTSSCMCQSASSALLTVSRNGTVQLSSQAKLEDFSSHHRRQEAEKSRWGEEHRDTSTIYNDPVDLIRGRSIDSPVESLDAKHSIEFYRSSSVDQSSPLVSRTQPHKSSKNRKTLSTRNNISHLYHHRKSRASCDDGDTTCDDRRIATPLSPIDCRGKREANTLQPDYPGAGQDFKWREQLLALVEGEEVSEQRDIDTVKIPLLQDSPINKEGA